MYFCTGIFVINFGTIEIIIYLVNGNILRLLEVVHCQADNAIRHSIQTQLLVSHMPSSPRQIVATVVGNHPPYIYIIFLGVNIAFFSPSWCLPISIQEVRECDQNSPFNCAKDFWLADVFCRTFLTGRGNKTVVQCKRCTTVAKCCNWIHCFLIIHLLLFNADKKRKCLN